MRNLYKTGELGSPGDRVWEVVVFITLLTLMALPLMGLALFLRKVRWGPWKVQHPPLVQPVIVSTVEELEVSVSFEEVDLEEC